MKIFISYRRADSKMTTAQIAEALKAYFGPDNVTLDTDFDLNEDYHEALMEWLEASPVVVVVIGRDWAAMLARPRKGTDWHLREIEEAFRQKKSIIPVLLDSTRMPETLPESIKYLRLRYSINIRTQTLGFGEDVQRLIREIEDAALDW